MTSLLRAEHSAIKFGIGLQSSHPLSHPYFFGYDGTCMLTAHLDNRDSKISEHTTFEGYGDSGLSGDVLVFETSCPVSELEAEYQKCVDFLNSIALNPKYNFESQEFDDRLETLEENNIDVFASEPDMVVFDRYNLLTVKHTEFDEYMEDLGYLKS